MDNCEPYITITTSRHPDFPKERLEEARAAIQEALADIGITPEMLDTTPPEPTAPSLRTRVWQRIRAIAKAA
jgi:hypothetical protein